ncbi:hypothetical protein B0H14DRAFT_2607889 [Mycena olivaceomarginata]|nr:hypothetical protein B0H14DRAFT_2607889 [Mycena olivaceomarginata]
MSAVGDNNGSDNHGSDESTGGDLPRGWHKGKKRQNSAERQVQELEEAEEVERQAVEARALAEAALSPEEREERRRSTRFETKRQIAEAKKSVARAEALRRLISAGKATDHDKAETVELLGRGESPDANDVPDENLDSDDESTDPDAGPKMVVLMEMKRPRNQSTPASQRPASVLTPEPEEDADGEMDVDENDPEENRPEEDHPETSHSSHIQEWLAGLEPAEIAQSEDTGDMELDGPGEFGPFLQLAPDLILVPVAEEPKPKEEEPSEAEMLARSAGRKEEKAREEELARVEAQMAELQSKRDALAATKAVKLELLPVELPAQAQLLEDTPSGFRAGLRPDGRVEFVLDDDDEEPVASGSGTRPDPETKED